MDELVNQSTKDSSVVPPMPERLKNFPWWTQERWETDWKARQAFGQMFVDNLNKNVRDKVLTG